MPRGEPLLRQWNLLKNLQANYYGLSADELADRLGCSKRQVQRDLNLLMEIGFPVFHEARDFGKRFWRLCTKAFDEDGLLLSVTEMVSLFVGQQLLAPLAGTQFGDGLGTALEKIKALLPKRALEHFRGLDETLMVKQAARHDYSGQDKEIRILNRAITECGVLKVRYHSASRGREFETELHPYGLVFFGSSLYVIGLLAAYEEVRTLKVDRVRGLQQTGRAFERPWDFSLKSYLDGSFGVFAPGKLQTIEVRFTGWAATNVREHEWHPSQKIVSDKDGELVAKFDLSDTTEFKRWVLGFGKYAVVLQPPTLAGEIASELSAAARRYV
jgi:predicted DNA-binding transcriptional regulator YafY